MSQHRLVRAAVVALLAGAVSAACAQAVPGSAGMHVPTGAPRPPGTSPTARAAPSRTRSIAASTAAASTAAASTAAERPTATATASPTPTASAPSAPAAIATPATATPTTATPTTATPTTATPTTATPVPVGPTTPAAGTPPGQGGPPAAPGSDPFASHEIVAYYGAAGTSSLGVLGQGTPAQAWTKLDAQATPYDVPGRPALRCFELIATVASNDPGSGGLYRNRVAVSAIEPYLATIRAHGGTLLLDIQPGRSDFLTEAEALEPLLIQPDVGLALDPEWRMTADQLPGQVIGSVSAAEVNSVSSWLDALTVSHHLPDKLFVVHEFTESELRDEDDLENRPHLHEIVNVDGFGSVAVKLSVYHHLARLSPFPMGLKLFYRQDPVLISPAGVEALRPLPQLVDYE